MKISYNNVSIDQNITLENKFESIDNNAYSILDNLSSLRIVLKKDLLLNTIKITNEFKKNKNKFVIFGTGGSNLGARALVNINFNKNVEFYDNIDPIHFENSFQDINFETTGFVVISKSGTTPETLSQLGAIIEIAKEKKKLDEFYSNTLIITESKTSPLYNIAKKNNCLYLEHEKDIGGRFSVFSNVGMVPAILSGLKVQEFQEGARNIYENYKIKNLNTLGRIFRFQSSPKYRNNVIMTYSDSLYFFGKWYLQLWSESIGKDQKGITAIHSVGTTDQHSQLQLFLDGPRDKLITFIGTNTAGLGELIPTDLVGASETELFKGRRLGDLFEAEYEATARSLISSGCPVRRFHLEGLSEKGLGALLTHFMIEIILVGDRFGVNPFDQPAVEAGKALTRKLMLRIP